MTPAEALAVVGTIASAFRAELAEETAKLWAAELTHYEITDALSACETMAVGMRFMPSLNEMVVQIRQTRNLRLEEGRAQPALPRLPYTPLALHLHEHPADADVIRKMDGHEGHDKRCCEGDVIAHTFAQILEGEIAQ